MRKINDAVGLGLINSDRGEALKGMAWNGMTKSLENLDKDGKKVDETVTVHPPPGVTEVALAELVDGAILFGRWQ